MGGVRLGLATRIQISKPFFPAFRLARSRSPKPLGFGAGEVQRKCVCGNEKSAGRTSSCRTGGWREDPAEEEAGT
jgi:hypothetical protein